LAIKRGQCATPAEMILHLGSPPRRRPSVLHDPSSPQAAADRIAMAPDRQAAWPQDPRYRATTRLLAGTALAGGLALVAAAPQRALAACDVTAAPNSVNCFFDTTTINTTNTNAISPSSNQRVQRFITGGAVTATVHPNVVVGGSGLAIAAAQPGATLTVTHDGTISQTSPGAAGGTGALRLTANGGLITYSGSGSVFTNQPAVPAVFLSNSGAGGINFGTAGTPIVPNYSGTVRGLQATTTDGATNIFLNGGAVTAGSLTLVTGQSNGTGAVNIALTGGTTIAGAGTAGVAALALGSGSVAISSDANIGSAGQRLADGVQATRASGAGTVNVTQTGGTIFGNSGGIVARNFDTGSTVVDQQAGSVDATGTGITAEVFGAAGGVTVTVGGGVAASTTGVFASVQGIANAAAVLVTVNAGVVGSDVGVSAAHNGTGAIAITTTANVTGGTGAGIKLTGGAANTTANAAGVTISGTVGVQASSAALGGTVIENAGIITGTGGTAVQFAAGTNTLIMNGTGAALNGNAAGNGADTFRLAGTGANSFNVGQIGAGWTALQKTGSSSWALTGTATTNAATTISGGTLIVNGSLASSSSLTVNAGGTLAGGGGVGNVTVDGGALAPGNSIGTLTVQGNLAFTSAATYLVEVSPSAADRTNATGTATLAGTVNAQFAPGSYLQRSYTIVSAAGGRNGTFDALTTSNLPAGFSAQLSYTANDALLSLVAALGLGGLNPNQQNVANSLTNVFNIGGMLPPSFVTVFGLSGAPLANTLSQLTGEVGAAAPQSALQSTQSFLGLMLDPFVAGRSGGGGPIGFAADPADAMPDEIALAYARAMPDAMPVKAPPMLYEPRWSVWGSAYGGTATVNGDAVVGSHSTDSRVGGFAAGADYRLARDTVLGFALAGGGTSWSLANRLGSGRSDVFQGGVYGSHRFGPAYVSTALAYAWHDTTTTRTVSIGPETLQGRFRPHVLAARLEGGYRFGWGTFGVTPYAAAQLQSFRAPSYTEAATAGAGTFALSYASQTETATRTELGAWLDHRHRLGHDTELVLRGRAAWAHDYDTTRRIAPSFVALPGASFTVDGAAASPDLALVSAVAELRLRGGVSLSAKFDGEFGARSESYAATGALRYAW
jgi:uncharacterized protein with beta-barrel porin domain